MRLWNGAALKLKWISWHATLKVRTHFAKGGKVDSSYIRPIPPGETK